MPTLTCEISDSLMRALRQRSEETGETCAHIVMTALADTLDLEHRTLFQVSTAGSLVKGVFGGVVTIGALRDHGDFGLGTFDGLDGEMVVLDGHFYQIRGDGQIYIPPDDAKVPFAVLAHFAAEHEFQLTGIAGFDDLSTQLSASRKSENLFCAVRIDGWFARMHARAACRADPGSSLVEATSHQAEFTFSDVSGTIVGFWTPPYARSINVPGWHLHFLTADRSGGGHVLDCAAPQLHVQTHELSDVRLAIPETPAFLQADLSQDPSGDLEKAERGGTVR